MERALVRVWTRAQNHATFQNDFQDISYSFFYGITNGAKKVGCENGNAGVLESLALELQTQAVWRDESLREDRDRKRAKRAHVVKNHAPLHFTRAEATLFCFPFTADFIAADDHYQCESDKVIADT